MEAKFRVEGLARRRSIRAAGLMSGTSADGVDAAIVDFDGKKARLVAAETFPYPESLRRAVLKLSDPSTGRVDDLCRLNFEIGERFAEAFLRLLRRRRISRKSVDIIGSHGQTICHLPGRGATLQIGEPSVIAERTGVTTVADFRPRDIAAGGEGAPLVPYADYILFHDRRLSRAVQNIGGIGNVTFLPAGAPLELTLAFDTGPGNMMMDRAARLASRGRLSCDRGGKMAARGAVDARLLGELLRHPFLKRRPPKTTGREGFGAALTDGIFARARKRGLYAYDILATLTAFTAETIALAYKKFLPSFPDEVIATGGGSRNPTLMGMLAKLLAPAKLRAIDEFGIPANAKEAVSFAILACLAVKGLPNNVPSATGARRAVVMGKIIPG